MENVVKRRRGRPKQINTVQDQAVETAEDKHDHALRIAQEDRELRKRAKTVTERYLEMATEKKIIERFRTPNGWKTQFFALAKYLNAENPELLKRLRKEKRVAIERYKENGKEQIRFL